MFKEIDKKQILDSKRPLPEHIPIDGNGRTSRLLLNLELMKNGFPQIVIRTENRVKYYNTLDKAHTTKANKDFIQLVVDELNKTLDLYLNLIK